MNCDDPVPIAEYHGQQNKGGDLPPRQLINLRNLFPSSFLVKQELLQNHPQNLVKIPC